MYQRARCGSSRTGDEGTVRPVCRSCETTASFSPGESRRAASRGRRDCVSSKSVSAMVSIPLNRRASARMSCCHRDHVLLRLCPPLRAVSPQCPPPLPGRLRTPTPSSSPASAGATRPHSSCCSAPSQRPSRLRRLRELQQEDAGKSGLRRGSGRGCDESEDVGQAVFEGPRMKAPSLLLAVTGSSSARWVARLECAPLAADRSRTSDLLLIAWFIVYPPGDAIAGSGSDPGAPRVRGVPHVDA
jgi:hypothetical protein